MRLNINNLKPKLKLKRNKNRNGNGSGYRNGNRNHSVSNKGKRLSPYHSKQGGPGLRSPIENKMCAGISGDADFWWCLVFGQNVTLTLTRLLLVLTILDTHTFRYLYIHI